MAIRTVPLPAFKQSDIQRFWKHVSKEPGPCWIWTAAKAARGTRRLPYGVYGFQVNGRWMTVAAHRASYYLHNGVDPLSSLVCHSCDEPTCVNPAHLFVGTQGENIADMVAKNRNAKGSKNGWAVLKEEDVHEMRKLFADGMPNKDIASIYGIDKSHVWRIVTRRVWLHIA